MDLPSWSERAGKWGFLAMMTRRETNRKKKNGVSPISDEMAGRTSAQDSSLTLYPRRAAECHDGTFFA
jgi:hypothetical protein